MKAGRKHPAPDGTRTTGGGGQNFLELLDDQHLSLKICKGILEVVEALDVHLLGIAFHNFLTGDVFTGRDFRENFLFHWPNPWLWLKAEKHGNVSFGGVADAIVEKSTHDDIRIQLHVGPVVKCELINSVEQFLLLLKSTCSLKAVKLSS